MLAHLIESKLTTLELHTVGGTLTPERTRLHASLVRDIVEAAGAQEGRDAVLYMGGPASGKTSVYERLGPSVEDGYVYVNADAVRTRLPEYQEMLDAGDLDAAAATHDEASAIAKRCIDVARLLGRSLVIDAVGKDDRGQLSTTLEALLDHGYSILLRCVTVPVEVAEKREQERARTTGRMVPLEELRIGHREVSRAFQSVAELPRLQIELYDTSGLEPRLIAEKADNVLEVLDEELYHEFLRKADD